MADPTAGVLTLPSGAVLRTVDDLLSLCCNQSAVAADLIRARGGECAAWVRGLGQADAAQSERCVRLGGEIERAQAALARATFPPLVVIGSLVTLFVTPPPAPAPPPGPPPPAGKGPVIVAAHMRPTLWMLLKTSFRRPRGPQAAGRTTRFLDRMAEELRVTRRQIRRAILAGSCLAALLAGGGAWWLHAQRTELDAERAGGFRDRTVDEVFQRARRSIVLVVCHWRARGASAWCDSKGTGFVVADETVATNKHVVRPWLFAADPAASDGGVRGHVEVEAGEVQYFVYPEDRRILREVIDARTGEPATVIDYDEAPFSSRCGQVRLAKAAPDEIEGGVHSARSDLDLALLEVSGVGRPALALDPWTRLAPGDRLLALGFPSSVAKFEDLHVRVARREFTVEQVQRRIMLAEAAQGGLSGGPLLARNGKVVGIVEGILPGGDARGGAQGYAIRAEHLERLMR